MRTQDLFLFVADHDDHHLARITQLLKIFSGQSWFTLVSRKERAKEQRTLRPPHRCYRCVK